MIESKNSRRDFIKTAFWGTALTSNLLAGFSIAQKSEPVKSSRPNIIYILADDLGYGDLSCYGQTRFKTPNIDRISTEGIKFTQHYSGSTVCAPSRCSLLTGLHTGNCQIRGNQEVQPEGQRPLQKGTVTIPALMKKAGYKTGAFGKWGLGYPGSTGDPMEFFDEFFGFNCQRLAHNYYPAYLWHNRQKIHLDGRTYSHDLIMNAAKDFIRKNKKQPFFCYLPVAIPHASLHAPKQLHDKYRRVFKKFDKKVGRYSGADVQNPVAAFAAMIEHLDNGVGEILEILKELDIDNNTIVMFASDNGPHLEGGADPRFFNSSGPLKGYKRDLYEGGIRVPFLVRWPGKIRAGSQTDHISAFWDLMPTCADLAGIDLPEDIDGISFLPTILNCPAKQKKHSYLYWEFSEQGGKKAVRMGKWKAIRLNCRKNPEGPIQLYDLDKDPGEINNVAGDNLSIVSRMNKIMTEAHTASQL